MKTNRMIKLHQVMMNRKNGTWMKTRTLYLNPDGVSLVSWLGDINGTPATEITFTTGKKIMVSETPEALVKSFGVETVVADPTEGEPKAPVEFTIAIDREELSRAVYGNLRERSKKAVEALKDIIATATDVLGAAGPNDPPDQGSEDQPEGPAAFAND